MRPKGTSITEYDLKQWILGEFEAAGLQAEDGPDVAVNATPATRTMARRRNPRRPFVKAISYCSMSGVNKKPLAACITTSPGSAISGKKFPKKYAKVFRAVRDARDKAVDLIRSSVAAGKPLQGWQVDKAARAVIEKAGYGEYFFHRTGHNIGEMIHGDGANMDGLETHDVRRLIPSTVLPSSPASICRNLASAAK